MPHTGKRAAVLFLAGIFLFTSVLTIVFRQPPNKVITSEGQNELAFEAADAGLQYAIGFFLIHSSDILATAHEGVIHYNIGPLVTSNKSSFSALISNPIANNYDIIDIVVTGLSPDHSKTSIIRQKLGASTSYIMSSIMSLKAVEIGSNTTIKNTITNMNIQTGGALTIHDGARTYTSYGQTSTKGNVQFDVQQHVTAMQALTANQFFFNLFNATDESVINATKRANTYFKNAIQNGDYSQLVNHKQGLTIYIDQSHVVLGQGIVVGTPEHPVTLIVQGNLTITNSAKIYGLVYARSILMANHAEIFGGIASTNKITLTPGAKITFLQVSKTPGITTNYTSLTGTWKDV